MGWYCAVGADSGPNAMPAKGRQLRALVSTCQSAVCFLLHLMSYFRWWMHGCLDQSTRNSAGQHGRR